MIFCVCLCADKITKIHIVKDFDSHLSSSESESEKRKLNVNLLVVVGLIFYIKNIKAQMKAIKRIAQRNNVIFFQEFKNTGYQAFTCENYKYIYKYKYYVENYIYAILYEQTYYFQNYIWNDLYEYIYYVENSIKNILCETKYCQKWCIKYILKIFIILKIEYKVFDMKTYIA